MTEEIQPCLVVESKRFHDEDIAIPTANRKAVPGGMWIDRQWPTIDKDFAIVGLRLIKDGHHVSRGHDFENVVEGARNPKRQAPCRWIVLRQTGFVNGNGPRLKRHILRPQVGHDVPEMGEASRRPKS